MVIIRARFYIFIESIYDVDLEFMNKDIMFHTLSLEITFCFIWKLNWPLKQDMIYESLCNQCNDSHLWFKRAGDCIWASWVCDGDADCYQHEDEENCHGPSIKPLESPCPEFMCIRSGGCVPNSAVCNGRRDCADNSDEEGCGSIIPGN